MGERSKFGVSKFGVWGLWGFGGFLASNSNAFDTSTKVSLEAMVSPPVASKTHEAPRMNLQVPSLTGR